jgi:hypothetical protein
MPSRPARPEDQRQHVRYLSVADNALRLAICPEFRGHRALLRDVSIGGLGLLLDRPLEVGVILAIELRGAPEESCCTRVAQVMHARPYPTPADAPWLPKPSPLVAFLRGLVGLPPRRGPLPTCWLIGCRFNQPLPEEELQRLL